MARIKNLNYPYIIVCFTAEEVTYNIVVEQEPMCELRYFKGALIYLMAAYFIFNIAYPKPLNSLLVMIQHYIFGLADTQVDSPAVIQTVTALKRMDKPKHD